MIHIKNLIKKYGKLEVLNINDLTISPGIIGLLGPNGAGKTTLLRCIVGVIKPTKGTITMSDDIGIGYLPQNFDLFRELKVYEMMEFFCILKKIPKNEITASIDNVLSLVNLSDKKYMFVKSLSGGMIRRLGIAQAILGNPKIIILDEPTAGLDPEERSRFINIIKKISVDKTILISTHVVSDVWQICNSILIMNHGMIIENSNKFKLISSVNNCVFEVPSESVHSLDNIYIISEDNGIGFSRILSKKMLEGFFRVEATLEDAYLYLINEENLL